MIDVLFDPFPLRDTDEIHPPPKSPAEFASVNVAPETLGHISIRLADMSDNLFGPDGYMVRMEERMERRAELRHREVLLGFVKLTNEILELKQRADMADVDLNSMGLRFDG